MRGQDKKMQPGEILLYQTEDGKTRLEVQFQGETVWLSQAQMAELFQTTKQNVSLHIRNIYDEHELERTGTVKESLTVPGIKADFKAKLETEFNRMIGGILKREWVMS